MLKKVIHRYYGFELFFNLILWVPVFYEIQKKSGLNDSQIFGIQSFYYLAFIFFEIPTGFLADKFGHRRSMFYGAVALLGANLLPMLASNYWGFLIHFLGVALARSLVSGAAGAYLYGFLKNHNEEKKYKEIEGKARSFGLMAKIICWSAVGYLMTLGVYLPYWLTALSALIAAWYGFKLPSETPLVVSSDAVSKSIEKPSIKQALTEIFATKMLLLLMLQGVGLFVLARITQVNLFQPILNFKEFPVASHGMIMAIMTACEAVGSAKAKILRAKFPDIQALYILTIITALTLSAIALSNTIGVLVSLCVFSLAIGLGFPIQKQVLNDQIKGPSRATIISIESIFDRSFAAIAVLPLGYLIGAGKLANVLFGATVIFILVITVIHFFIYKQQQKEVFL